MQKRSTAEAPMVRMAHISKTFNQGSVNEKTVFTDFNLAIARGEFVSVIGSNGSGKTTMLNLLCGSLPSDGGEIEVAGKRIDRLREHQRSKIIGRVCQDPAKGTCAAHTLLENMVQADNRGRAYLLARGVNRRR